MFHFHCIRYKPTLIASDGVATETWLELQDRHWDFVKKAGSGSRRLKFSWLTQFFKNISQKKVINTFELSLCHILRIFPTLVSSIKGTKNSGVWNTQLLCHVVLMEHFMSQDNNLKTKTYSIRNRDL